MLPKKLMASPSTSLQTKSIHLILLLLITDSVEAKLISENPPTYTTDQHNLSLFQCLDGSFLHNGGCQLCDCHRNGTKACDKSTGQCICKDNVIGPRCDKCTENFFGLNEISPHPYGGCKQCACNNLGSIANSCNQETGQCLCKSGYRHRTCDECDVTHYRDIREGSLACVPCDCHPKLSQSQHINSVNLQMLNTQCDSDGEFNSSNHIYCQSNAINLTRHCDIVTGQCVCSPGSTGEHCEKCAARFTLSSDQSNCSPCGTCSTSLMDFIDEVSQDLNYANKTIEKGRLAASIGAKISELESALAEHSNGFSLSGKMIATALNLISQHVGSASNLTLEDVSLLIEKLDSEAKDLEFEVSKLSASPRDYNSVRDIMFAVKNLAQEFSDQFDSLSNEISNLDELLDDNHKITSQNELKISATKDLVEFDNRELRALTSNAEKFLSNQIKVSTDMSSIIKDIMAELTQLTDYELEAKGISTSQSERLLASILFNETLSSSECENSSAILKNLIDYIESVNLGLKETKTNLTLTKQLVESSVPEFHEENDLVQEIKLSLKKSEMQLNHVWNRFNRSCSNTFAILMKNMDNMTSVDSHLSTLKILTHDLDMKTANMSIWLQSDAQKQQSDLYSHNQIIFENFRNMTQTWDRYLYITQASDDAYNHLNHVNDTLEEIDKVLGTYRKQVIPKDKIISNTTVQMNMNMRQQLLASLSSSKSNISKLEQNMDRDRKNLDLLNHSMDKSAYSKLQLFNELDSINRSIEEKESLNNDIDSFRSIITEIHSKYVDELHDPISTSFNFSSAEFDHLVDHTTITNEYLAQLKALTEELNSTEVSQVARAAEDEIEPSVESLQQKVEKTRLLLNHIRLGRQFVQGSRSSGYVKLRNPIDLSESSTYTSISFFIKTDNYTDGLILFIGTSSANRMLTKEIFALDHRLDENRRSYIKEQRDKYYKNSSVQWNEYVAVELRGGCISVAVNLGSQIVEEIEDDVSLRHGSWHKVGIIRVGTLLSISVKSQQSSSSLTRSLISPHTVLDLDTERTDIYVGGLPDKQMPLGIKSKFGLSGHIDDLRLNEHRLGLWNTVATNETYTNDYKKSIFAQTNKNVDQTDIPVADSNTSISKRGSRIELLNESRVQTPLSDSNYVQPKEYNNILNDEEDSPGEVFQFSNGYMSIDAPGCDVSNNNQSKNSNKSITLISFKFRTGITNSLLFFVQLSNSSSDYLSIQLNLGQLELLVLENGTISSTLAPQKQQSTSYLLADHSWHLVECILKPNLNSQTQSIQLRVDTIQKGSVILRTDLSGLCASNILIGGGLRELETNPGQKLHQKLHELQLLHHIAANNFTGCLQSISFSWIEETIYITSASHLKNVRERACQEPVRMVSFPRPKSNISSSFVQFLNVNNELDGILLEDNEQVISNRTLSSQTGHIRRLTIRFKTQQSNGLLVHHSRPDHSSFISVFIQGGRLTIAFNFDKNIRFESHLVLSDGQWHTVYLKISRHLLETLYDGKKQNLTKAQYHNQLMRYSIIAILDDRYVYKDHFDSLVKSTVNSTRGPKTASQDRTIRTIRALNPMVNLQHSAGWNETSTMTTQDNSTKPRPSFNANLDNLTISQPRKVLYFGGVEDKFIPLLRNQQIPTNFQGCIADVTINDIRLDFVQTNKNQGVLMNQCQLIG